MAFNLDRAGAWLMHPGDRLDESGFAATVLADQTMNFAGLDVPIDLFESTHASETFGESSEAQKRHGIISHSANSDVR